MAAQLCKTCTNTTPWKKLRCKMDVGHGRVASIHDAGRARFRCEFPCSCRACKPLRSATTPLLFSADHLTDHYATRRIHPNFPSCLGSAQAATGHSHSQHRPIATIPAVQPPLRRSLSRLRRCTPRMARSYPLSLSISVLPHDASRLQEMSDPRNSQHTTALPPSLASQRR